MLVDAYAQDTNDRREIVLPSSLSTKQRRDLHIKCANLRLNSASEYVRGARRLVVTARTSFRPPERSIGTRALGCAVVKAHPSPPICGVVVSYAPATSTWAVKFENEGGLSTFGFEGLCAIIKARHNFDRTGSTQSDEANRDEATRPSWTAPDASRGSALKGLLDKFDEHMLKSGCEWYETAEHTTGQDHSHWMQNCMAMCSSNPDDPAYQKCLVDLSDVLFKIVDGQQAHLSTLMASKYTDMSVLPRSWWRKWARYHCPEPRQMTMDFYDWY